MPQPPLNSFQATLGRTLPALSAHLGGRRLPFLVFLALVVLIAWLAARLSWQFASPPTVPGAGTTIAASAAGADRGQDNLVARITSAHLFGTANAPNPDQVAANAPKTSLDLTLLGVAAGGQGFPSQAIIANGSNSDQHTYAIGATLPGGAVVHDIFTDRVVIAHDGRLESLSLPQAGTSILASGMRFGSGHGVNLPPPSGQDGNQTRLNVSPQLRRQIEKQPQTLLHYLRFRPYSNQGKVEGYRVYPGKESSLFEHSGLQPGDIVTQVNGISLGEGGGAMKAMAQLRHAHGTVQLEVKRHGTPVHITLHVPGG